MQTYELQCRFCGGKERLELDPGKVADWQNGSLIQRVFPELSMATRELMISKTCDKCFKGMFGDDE